MIRLPFRTGTSWMVSQGYNTSPVDGGSHWNCDPDTLRDDVSRSTSCRAGWQYKYSLDLRRPSGSSVGEPVISPVDGTIRWIDEAKGGMSINMGNGYAVAFFHATLNPGIAAGQPVKTGQPLGTVAPAGEAGNGGSPHIHLTVWQTDDGGNWSRNPRPFTGDLAVDGYDLPDLGASERNQYRTSILYSSNSVLEIGSDGIPAAPAPREPANGANAESPVEFSWNAVDGAANYQVVVDGNVFSDWTSSTSLSMTLAEGEHRWQVRARNDAGTGSLSASRSVTIGTANATTGPTVTVSDSTGEVGEVFTIGGSGFTPGETATITWRSQTMRTLTIPASGSFSTPITIPQAPHGTWRITVSTSGGEASADFRVVPSLERDPVRGAPGTLVTITVNGFDPNERVELRWRSATGPVMASILTNGNGSGTVSISLPDAPTGWTDYTGLGQSSNLRAWGAIQIQPSVTLSPATAKAGDRVTVTGRGFPASSGGTVRLGDNSTDAVELCSLSTSSTGRGGCTFTVPGLPTGGFAVTIETSNGVTAGTTLAIEGPPSVSVSPESAASGTEIIVRIGGFAPNESVAVSWDGESAWRSVTTDKNGNATIDGTVPKMSAGDASLRAQNMSGTTDAVAAFEVAPKPNPGTTTMTGTGAYTVVATREGLVGTSTSSGHIIVPNDHFVSLPACTATSCSWFEAGKVDERWGIRTECGDHCYVMAINEDTGACEVAPVLDVGPWFTVDDWWKPGPERYLNQLPSNPNYLAQGVTGAGAARNGLDVGYGIGPNGIGSSNRYATVGNAAVIDLADGTWTAIGLDFNQGIDVIDVELLWQTGQSPEAAAAECGHPLDQSGDTGDLTLSVAQGEVGSQVRVDGGSFNSGELVRLYVGSTDTPVVVNTSANSSGDVSAIVTIPETPYGVSKIIAVGGDSGTVQESIFSITPSIERVPTSGGPDTKVTITVHGYGANEQVQLWWDDPNGDEIGTLRTNAWGTGLTVITIPNDRVSGWNTYYARGVTSGAGAFGAFNVIGGATPTPAPSDMDPTIQALVDALIKVLMQVLAELTGSGGTSDTMVITTTTVRPGSNPSFKGQALPVVDITASALPSGPETTDPGLAIDGDSATAWSTTGGDPERASITLDLGLVQPVTGIRWRYSQPDGIDQQILQVSSDGESWDQLIVTSARQPQQWEGIVVDRDIRYVRLVLTNDTNLPVLGYLAEIEVWGEGAPQSRIAMAQASAETESNVSAQAGTTKIIATPTAGATPASQPDPDATTVDSKVSGTALSAPSPTPEPTATPSPTPTVAPTVAPSPTAVPTTAPTPEPVLQTREVVVPVSADVSVNSLAPDAGEDPPGGGALFLGGPDGETAGLTFDIPALDGGEIASAKLVVQGAGDAGSGGPVFIASSVRVDGGFTWNTLQGMIGAPAASLGWIDAGVETAVDVTGWIPAKGPVTVILAGTPEQRVMITSQESGAPAYLVLTIEEWVTPNS